MRKLTNTLKKIWNDESGQGATEYILLLVIVVAIALLFRTQIRDIIQSKLGDISQSVSGFTTNF